MKKLHTTGLVLELKFNEGVGTVAYDSSGNDNHGTIVSATWPVKAGSLSPSHKKVMV